MRIVCRFVRCFCVTGFLAAFGLGIFLYIRLQPRFVVAGNHEVMRLSADGRWLVTCEIEPTALAAHHGIGAIAGRLHVYDTRSGRQVRTVETQRMVVGPQGCCCNGGLFGPMLLCQSGNGHWFAWTQQDNLILLNWRSGMTLQCQVDVPLRNYGYEFSPTGKWLILSQTNEDRVTSIVVEVERARVVHRFASPVLAFLQQDRFALIHADRQRLDCIDLETGLVCGSMQTECECMGDVSVSPDGSWLVLGLTREAPERPPGVEIWDLANRRCAIRFDEENWKLIDLVFSHKHGRFAAWMSDGDAYHIALFDGTQGQTGMTLHVAPRPTEEKYVVPVDGVYSPDDAKLMLNCNLGDKCKIMMIDVETGRLLWQKIDARGRSFSVDGALVLCSLGPTDLPHSVDAATGDVRAAPTPDLHQAIVGGTTPDGRRMLIHGATDASRPAPAWQQWLGKFCPQWFAAPTGWHVVTEQSAGRELLRIPARQTTASLSEDGGTLVTSPFPGNFLAAPAAARRVEVWDVDRHRALYWAAFWPIALGVGVLIFLRWRKARNSSKYGSPTPHTVESAL